MSKDDVPISLELQEMGVIDGSKAHKYMKKLLEENIQLKNNIIKAIHRIQLLQMDGEVEVRDLGLIVRDLKGDGK